jgi:hypothetical protein
MFLAHVSQVNPAWGPTKKNLIHLGASNCHQIFNNIKNILSLRFVLKPHHRTSNYLFIYSFFLARVGVAFGFKRTNSRLITLWVVLKL